jgi:integrase
MPRTLNRLKPLTVERAKTPGRYADGGGLYLVVKPGPRRSWAFLYRKGSKATELGLGSIDDVSLVQAREKAAELRNVLVNDGDPRAHRERKAQEQALLDAQSITFETTSRNYHERHKPKWRSDQYARQWLRHLELHAFPKIGNLNVGDVDLAAVQSVIEPIWYDKPRVAQLVRANVESVLNFAKAMGWRKGDNPAQWDVLKHALPARKGARAKGHFRALHYSDMPELLTALKAERTVSALCMQFTVYTVARTIEATPCHWSQVDFNARIRSVPVLKGGGVPWLHQVPLSDQAVALLRGLLVDGKPATEHVFPGRGRRRHLGTGAMLDLLERIGWNSRTTTHGIRAAFKTWATERTNYPREVVELCLSHVQRDELERAYQRGDILDKRRRLLQEWADFCEGTASEIGKVVPIRAA